MTTKKTGRPTVMNGDTVRKLIEAFQMDVPVEEACVYAGISKDTYYRHLRRPDFSDEMERARMFATLRARQTVVREIGEDGDLALRYLERKRKSEFSPRAEVSVEGDYLTKIIKEVEANARPVQWENIEPVAPNQGIRESASEEDAKEWEEETEISR